MIEETHKAFVFTDEPRCIDLGNGEIYIIFKNDYIQIVFDVTGEILTRDEYGEVFQRYLSTHGKKFSSGLIDIP